MPIGGSEKLIKQHILIFFSDKMIPIKIIEYILKSGS